MNVKKTLVFNPDLAFKIVMRRRRSFTGKERRRFWLKGLLEYFDVKIVLSDAAGGADFKS